MKIKEFDVEQTLRNLYDLQLIDTHIDKIQALKGELPDEIEEMGQHVNTTRQRLEALNEELEDFQKEIKQKEVQIDHCKDIISRSKKKQEDIKNNREYLSLEKEIEYQNLEIELAQKKIKEKEHQIESKQEYINTTAAQLADTEEQLSIKEAELKEILAETEKEEDILSAKREEYSKEIQADYLYMYERIRGRLKNKLVVVPIERGASTGSYISIPPQRQMEVKTRKSIIRDEHSGRILVDEELAQEELDKIQALIKQLTNGKSKVLF